MQLPMPVSALAKVLPHRPPMVWIDEVLVAAADGATCAIDLKPTALYAAADGSGHYLTFAPIEWIAQAFGYARCCFEMLQVSRGLPASQSVRRAFLAGVGEYEVLSAGPTSGRLLVDAKVTREMAPLTLIDGSVRTEDGVLLATAKLKLYYEF